MRFVPAADAQVKSSSPSTNYGSLDSLRVREETASAPINYRSYLRFDVSGFAGQPRAVKLRLYVTDASVQGGAVYVTSNAWVEGSMNWTTAPTIPATPVAAGSGTPAIGQWYEVTIPTSSVPGNGTYSFALKSASTDSAIFASREDPAHSPELVLTP